MPTNEEESRPPAKEPDDQTSQPVSTPPSQSGPEKTSSKAVTSLVLGVLGLICCQLFGPVAWYLGRQELNNIRQGVGAAKDEGVAKAGMILGIIGSVLLGLGIIWVLFLGGMAIVGAVLGGMGG